MVASRNQFHQIAREFGAEPNGSLPAFGAVGEMNNYLTNPRSATKYRKTTSLGQPATLTEGLGGAGLVAVGMIYFGMDMPGANFVINKVKKAIEKPYQTTQYLMLGTGIGILAYRGFN